MRAIRSRGASKASQEIFDYVSHDRTSQYFLRLSLEEAPIDEEKLERRLKDDLYVAYQTLNETAQASFRQTFLSGILKLFFDDDLGTLQVGLLVVSIEKRLEDAKESPLALINDDVVRYVLELSRIRLKALESSKNGWKRAELLRERLGDVLEKKKEGG